MKKINSINEVKELINRHFLKNVFTNNFISDETYLKEIESDSLYYSENDSGLLFLRKRDGFFVMNFHLHGDSLPEIPDCKIVCEIPYKGEMNFKKLFSDNGFSLCIERIRMTSKTIGEESLKIRTATEKDFNEAYAFLLGSFCKYTGCIPNREEFLKDISDGFVLISGEGEVTGLLHFSKKGKSAEIRHLAVSEKERRKGVAGALINSFYNKAQALKYQVWLKKDNEPAFNLYKKYGFVPDGFESVVFTKGI